MTWWQRPGEDERRLLREQLLQVLPAPRTPEFEEIPLIPAPEPLWVAEAIHWTHGFTWLDCHGGVSRLFQQPLVTMRVERGYLYMSGRDHVLYRSCPGFDVLEAALDTWAGNGGAMLVGYLGYDLADELETLPPPAHPYGIVPDLYLALYDSHLRFEDGRCTLVRSNGWRAVEKHSPLAFKEFSPEPLRAGRVVSRPAPEEFAASIRRTVDRIHAGELFQTNLCRRLKALLPMESAWPLYRRMRAANPARYGAYVNMGLGQSLLSSSPELYLRVEEGVVRSSPIKGTRPLGAEEELLASEKERAELAMIVDVVRNDLARVCQPGSVQVEVHGELLRLPTLVHTASTVSGRLRPDAGGVAGLLRASFPPASISGAPKIHAMEVARLEEGRLRGPCMGSIGWMSLDGQAELSVAIRTAVAARGMIYYETGCGITAESVPETEVEETGHKARAFLEALS